MRLADIENGTVVNVIEVDPVSRPEFCVDWPEITEGGPGWSYDPETGFTPPVEDHSAWRGTASVPRGLFCTNLMAAGVLPPPEAVAAAKGEWPATFDAALASLTDIEAAAAQIEWAGATSIRRNHPMITTLAALAGMTDEQVDGLFGG